MSRHQTSRAPTAVDIAVGETIRRMRLERNMTLAELGHELGISHQQLQKYETGTNRLSAGMLSNVAEVLRVEITDLFEDAASGQKPCDPLKIDRDACHRIVDRAQDPVALGEMRRVLTALVTS